MKRALVLPFAGEQFKRAHLYCGHSVRLLLGVALCSSLVTLYLLSWIYGSAVELPPAWRQGSTIKHFQHCSIKTYLETGLGFLDGVTPIDTQEYLRRRDRLAQALSADKVDAFVVEPGYTFQYYANVSQKDWEVWEPEERPFLMIIRPVLEEDGTITAETSFLAPHFEVERAKLLGMPGVGDHTKFVAWEEHWNPYSTLKAMWKGELAYSENAGEAEPKIIVDEEMRDFIQRGLSTNGFKVVGLGGEVEKVRQTKSEKEIDILRAVKTGTVEAVRAVRSCMYPGLTEDEVAQVLDNTMRAAGMDPFFDIVLFDENASNPHGGTDGSKVLEAHTFVLIDVGAHLYGYSSDICRTFFPPFFKKLTSSDDLTLLSASIRHKMYIWDVVLTAQDESMMALHENATAASVDIAARNVIAAAGYEKAFTHRVGHGIGIKAHESPYLNKGNVETELRAGMVFTSEPGIYLVDEFGVRHEDIMLVKESGLPEVLSGRRAQDPWTP